MQRGFYLLSQYLAPPLVPPLPLDHLGLQYFSVIIRRNLKDHPYLLRPLSHPLRVVYLPSQLFVWSVYSPIVCAIDNIRTTSRSLFNSERRTGNLQDRDGKYDAIPLEGQHQNRLQVCPSDTGDIEALETKGPGV